VICYNLDLNRLASIYAQIGYALHPALLSAEPFTLEKLNKKINVLFVCTHNSARSQIAEALLRAESHGVIEVHSAGTEPSQIHPLAAQIIRERHLDPADQNAKALAQFTNRQFQYIITVCDRAKESCPIFPGDPVRVHWSIPDPSEVQGDERTRLNAFNDAANEIHSRIKFLLKQIQNDYTTVQVNGG
jgi:protein-tyrosine-phosphatase